MGKMMVIGVGWEQLPLIEKAKRLGLETVATTVWNKGKIPADRVYAVDSRDLNKLEDIFLEERPDAVLADECDYSMYAVAYLTDKYKLPGPGLHGLTITNNKFLQRRIAETAGILQPEYRLCWNTEMAIETADKIGYPVILKPTDNRGSIGVLEAYNEEEVKYAFFNAVANSHSRMCLVEKFIEGQLVAVDGFIDSERFNGLCVSTKDEYGGSKTVDKILYFPGPAGEEKKLLKITNRIVRSFGLRYGFIHAEYIIGENGIYFVEIANRGGGVHISNRILPEITGIDLMEKLIQMSLGEKIELAWNHDYQTKALMYFLAPGGTEDPGKIIDQYGEGLIALYLKSRENIRDLRTQGALGRAGVVILKGNDFQNMVETAREIEGRSACLEEEFYWGQSK